jgi:hypothetical protein
MEKFSADWFFSVGAGLGALRAVMDRSIQEQEGGTLDEAIRTKLSGALDNFSKTLQKIELKIACKAMENVRKTLTDSFDVNDFANALHTLEQTIEWEMQEVHFFYMPSEQVRCYAKSELFGQDVNTKFPMIQFDMVEAGNCYAMGRGTACVFHLMRIMEVGVQQFGTKLGVTFADAKNWQNILDEINKAIKLLPPKDPATKAMCVASANLFAVKLAWRNEVMHPKDTYTLEEADTLIGQVKLFMGQLASII